MNSVDGMFLHVQMTGSTVQVRLMILPLLKLPYLSCCYMTNLYRNDLVD